LQPTIDSRQQIIGDFSTKRYRVDPFPQAFLAVASLSNAAAVHTHAYQLFAGRLCPAFTQRACIPRCRVVSVPSIRSLLELPFIPDMTASNFDPSLGLILALS